MTVASPERPDGRRIVDLGPESLRATFAAKYGDVVSVGWSPRLRHRFGYFTPDDVYETVVEQLVGPTTTWIDVGAGRNVFPSNPKLARTLADRCRLLVGVDPDDTIEENPFVHRAVKCPVEEMRFDEPFDLVTLRMVAEHIERPDAAFASLARATRAGGLVVIYTVNKLSPVSLVAAAVPESWQFPIKNLFWPGESKDTFPVRYRMNSRRALRRIADGAGFDEVDFRRLDDCRALARWRAAQALELATWRFLNALRVPYPEHCLLGVYRKR